MFMFCVQFVVFIATGQTSWFHLESVCMLGGRGESPCKSSWVFKTLIALMRIAKHKRVNLAECTKKKKKRHSSYVDVPNTLYMFISRYFYCSCNSRFTNMDEFVLLESFKGAIDDFLDLNWNFLLIQITWRIFRTCWKNIGLSHDLSTSVVNSWETPFGKPACLCLYGPLVSHFYRHIFTSRDERERSFKCQTHVHNR